MSQQSAPENQVIISKIYRAMATIYRSKGDHNRVKLLMDKALGNGSTALLELLPVMGEFHKFVHDLSRQQ
jgi:hypothetical protein